MVEQNKMFTIIMGYKNKIMISYCKTCGSKLGIDCGDAEPDYNDSYCSVGCYESRHLNYESEKL